MSFFLQPFTLFSLPLAFLLDDLLDMLLALKLDIRQLLKGSLLARLDLSELHD